MNPKGHEVWRGLAKLTPDEAFDDLCARAVQMGEEGQPVDDLSRWSGDYEATVEYYAKLKAGA
jgi:hypothetical protein